MRFIFSILFFSFLTQIFAQNEIHKSKSWGIRLGLPLINEKLPEGRTYQPINLLGYFTLTNLAKKKKNNFWVYLEPQFVPVIYDSKIKSENKDIEFGANLGLRYEWVLSDFLLLTAAIGSGPHYVSVETEHQHKGFIFSDNMELGFRKLLKKSDWELNFHARFRHISNANLQKPNRGIDTWFLVLGFTKRL